MDFPPTAICGGVLAQGDACHFLSLSHMLGSATVCENLANDYWPKRSLTHIFYLAINSRLRTQQGDAGFVL